MSTRRILIKRGPASLGIVILAAALVGAWAIDGRDFAGIYQTTNEVELGESVSMTFTTGFVNYSGADIVGATVRLESPHDPESPYATFTAVDVAANAGVRLSQEITVPTREWDAWRDGAMPRLTVEYLDGEGNTHRRPAELMRDFLVEEVRP